MDCELHHAHLCKALAYALCRVQDYLDLFGHMRHARPFALYVSFTACQNASAASPVFWTTRCSKRTSIIACPISPASDLHSEGASRRSANRPIGGKFLKLGTPAPCRFRRASPYGPR